MLIKVFLATLLTLAIGATSALAASKASKTEVTGAYASVVTLPSADDQLFERAKGDPGGS